MNIVLLNSSSTMEPHEAQVRTDQLRRLMPGMCEIAQHRAEHELAELDRIIRPETAFDDWDYPTIY